MLNPILLSELARFVLAEEHPEARTVSLGLAPLGSILVLSAVILVLWILLSVQARRADLHEAPAGDHGEHH